MTINKQFQKKNNNNNDNSIRLRREYNKKVLQTVPPWQSVREVVTDKLKRRNKVKGRREEKEIRKKESYRVRDREKQGNKVRRACFLSRI